MSDFPKRGEVYWINLKPAVGSETRKLKPCMIISSNIANQYSPLVMVAPITSNTQKIYPFEVQFILTGKN